MVIPVVGAAHNSEALEKAEETITRLETRGGGAGIGQVFQYGFLGGEVGF